MNIIKRIFKNSLLVLVAAMLLTIPNMQVYSAVGSYKSKSMALVANQDYNATSIASDRAIWPAVLAAAAGVGLAVVGAVGVIDGWNSIHPETTLASLEFNYDKYDFSKFDN